MMPGKYDYVILKDVPKKKREFLDKDGDWTPFVTEAWRIPDQTKAKALASKLGAKCQPIRKR